MHLSQREMTTPETWWRESEVMQTCQQLWCDNSHTSYDSTHKCIKINEQQCIGGASTMGKVISLPTDEIDKYMSSYHHILVP